MLWLLRLQDNPSQTQVEQWQHWMNSDPANRQAFEQCLVLENKLENLPPQTVKKLLESLPDKKAAKVIRWPQRVALAASIAVVSIGFSIYLQPASTTYTTAMGETVTVTLTDGSNITLDSDTQLSAYVDENQRRIELHQGQAVFDVTKQTNRPFLVVVDEITVTVLGTRFNVNRVEDDAIISVEHGKVSVYDPTFGNTLLQAQQGYYSYDDRAVELNNTQFAMWQQGQIRFSHTPLNLAIDQLNRYQSKQLLLEQEQLNKLTVSGTFQLDDIAGMADLLPKILPVEIVAKNEHWLILPRKEGLAE